MSISLPGSPDVSASRQARALARPKLLSQNLVREKNPVIYFVIVPSDPLLIGHDFVERTGINTLLFSFAYMRNKSSLDRAIGAIKDNGFRAFLDSGAFTFQGRWIKATRGKIKSYSSLVDFDAERRAFQRDYIKFCQQFGSLFDCYANFDWKVDSTLVYSIQSELEDQGVFPLPTIHGDDGIEWLERYIDDGHKLIAVSRGPGLGRGRNESLFYLDRIFNVAEKRGTLLHGFSFTDFEIMLRYPWYSVDSSSWVHARASGNIFTVDDGKVMTIHVSDRLSKKKGGVTSWIKKRVDDMGFDFEMMRYAGEDKQRKALAWKERGLYNIYVLAHLRELGLASSGGGKRWRSLLS